MEDSPGLSTLFIRSYPARREELHQVTPIPLEHLEEYVDLALQRKFDVLDAQRIREVIMYALITGHTNHGIVPLLDAQNGVLVSLPEGKPVVRKTSWFSKSIDGRQNPGMLVAALATEEAIKLAGKRGIGVVTSKNGSSTSGCLGKFLIDITKEGKIGIIMSSTRPCVAAYGGTEPVLGTNPIAIGIPSAEDPFLFDGGTSVRPFNSILESIAVNRRLPSGMAIDRDGHPTRDPYQALDGALLPFGGYKGYGLSLAVQLLAGTLTGAIREDTPEGRKHWGNLVIVLDPEALGINRERFRQEVSSQLRVTKKSGNGRNNSVRIPGEHTLEIMRENLDRQEIEIPSPLLRSLVAFSLVGSLE